MQGNQIAQWRKQALAALPGAMGDRRRKEERDWEDEREALHGQIGALTMDIKWLKKVWHCGPVNGGADRMGERADERGAAMPAGGPGPNPQFLLGREWARCFSGCA
jgi:hypothetical protein